MTEMNPELLNRLVVGRKRDGRCRYANFPAYGASARLASKTCSALSTKDKTTASSSVNGI